MIYAIVLAVVVGTLCLVTIIKTRSVKNQADFLVRAFTKARYLDYVGGMFVWNLNFQLVVPQTDEKWGFGVVRDDWSPRPAYFAVAQMPKL